MFDVNKALEKLDEKSIRAEELKYVDVNVTLMYLREILLAGHSEEVEVDYEYIHNMEGNLSKALDVLHKRIAGLETRAEHPLLMLSKEQEQRLARLEAQYELNEEEGYVRFGTMKFKIQEKPVTEDKLDPKVWNIGARVIVKKSNTYSKPSEWNNENITSVHIPMGSSDVAVGTKIEVMAFNDKPSECDLKKRIMSVIEHNQVHYGNKMTFVPAENYENIADWVVEEVNQSLAKKGS